MDNVNQLQSQYLDFLTSLLHEGLVDFQFMQLLKLQSVAEPQFLYDIVNEFFDASDKIVHQFDTAIEHRINVDATLKDTVFQFKGANVSMGAPRLACVCIAFENNFGANNFQGCLTCCQQLKEEYYVVKIKLQTLIGLQQQILAAGGSIPVIG